MIRIFACAKICGPQDLRIPVIEGGFPHSEIRGSKFVRNSPRLIAAYYVLHRLSAPRHPPDALKALDCSHRRCPPLGRGSFGERLLVRRRRNRRLHFSRFQRKDQLASQIIRGCGCRSRRACKQARTINETASAPIARRECPDDLPLHDVIERKFPPQNAAGNRNFIKRTISAGPRSAIIEEDGGARRDRTDDLLLAKQALSQLSYGPARREGPAFPKCRTARKMVGLGRFELPTSRLSSARSNQLSYKPLALKARDVPSAPVKERRGLVRDEERETKTAVSRIVRPDWPAFVPKRSDEFARCELEGSSLERR